MFYPLTSILGDGLTKGSRVHFQHVVNQVGPITEAELDAQMSAAAAIHAREWNRTSHPADPGMPLQVHDWATRHIAANLVARQRGYDVERASYRPAAWPIATRAPLALRAATRTGED